MNNLTSQSYRETYHTQLAQDGDALSSGRHRAVGHLKQDNTQTKQIHFLQINRKNLSNKVIIPIDH